MENPYTPENIASQMGDELDVPLVHTDQTVPLPQDPVSKSLEEVQSLIQLALQLIKDGDSMSAQKHVIAAKAELDSLLS